MRKLKHSLSQIKWCLLYLSPFGYWLELFLAAVFFIAFILLKHYGLLSS